MKIKKRVFLNLLSCLFLVLISAQLWAQDDDNPDPDEDNTVKLSGIKGFHFGFYLGAYFANKATAAVYDGYGINLNGEKNSFENSYMHQKIIVENGGGFLGQPDRIAEQLEVQPNSAGTVSWIFDKSDMPVELKYKPSFLLGLHLNYGISNKGSVIFNVNFTRITATGIFTIITPKPPQATQYYKTVHTFPLRGNEQRTMIQLGYKQIFGNNKFVNVFAEGGFNINYAKVLKNFIQINNLKLDLTTFDYQSGYNYNTPKEYTGWGFGAFGGLGLYLRLNQKYTAEVVYSPSYDKVKIGLNPKSTVQHAIGARIYYRI